MKFFLALTLLLTGCFPTSRFDTCENNEQLAVVGGNEDCFTKCAAGCGGDTTCVDGICVSSELLRVDPDPVINNLNNNKPAGLTETEAEQLCQDLVDSYFGCADELCDLSPAEQTFLDQTEQSFLDGDEGQDGCVESAMTSPIFVESVQDFLTGSCEETQVVRCSDLGLALSCDCRPASKVGEVCEVSEDCKGGDFAVGCILEEANPFGYCTAECPDSQPQNPIDYVVADERSCGEGNYCAVAVDSEIRGGFCLRGCESQDDCDGDSVCAIFAVSEENEYTRFCNPFRRCDETACTNNNGRCRNGLCELTCAGLGQQLCENSSGQCEGEGPGFCKLP